VDDGSSGVLIENGKIVLLALYGVNDLVNLIVRPIPQYAEKFKHIPNEFNKRLEGKKWLEKWPKLHILR